MGLLNPWAQYLRETIDLMALKTWKRWQKRNRLAWVCLPYPSIKLKRAHEHYLNLVGTKGRAPTHCSAVVFESQCCRLGNRQSLEVKAKVHVFFPWRYLFSQMPTPLSSQHSAVSLYWSLPTSPGSSLPQSPPFSGPSKLRLTAGWRTASPAILLGYFRVYMLLRNQPWKTPMTSYDQEDLIIYNLRASL